eukprot:GHVT01063967.1.p1 GENE.GHVT01063967.1~~GHVT01063967.1.p1  ORF type:complete len:184 (+),score=15.33 GHVT01063967.1:199-750(+)
MSNGSNAFLSTCSLMRRQASAFSNNKGLELGVSFGFGHFGRIVFWAISTQESGASARDVAFPRNDSCSHVLVGRFVCFLRCPIRSLKASCCVSSFLPQGVLHSVHQSIVRIWTFSGDYKLPGFEFCRVCAISSAAAQACGPSLSLECLIARCHALKLCASDPPLAALLARFSRPIEPHADVAA